MELILDSTRPPTARPFWKRLKAHRERRHSVIHRGVKVPLNKSDELVAVVRKYPAHLETMLASFQAKQISKP
jgi:hypothetical protein